MIVRTIATLVLGAGLGYGVAQVPLGEKDSGQELASAAPKAVTVAKKVEAPRVVAAPVPMGRSSDWGSDADLADTAGAAGQASSEEAAPFPENSEPSDLEIAILAARQEEMDQVVVAVEAHLAWFEENYGAELGLAADDLGMEPQLIDEAIAESVLQMDDVLTDTMEAAEDERFFQLGMSVEEAGTRP